MWPAFTDLIQNGEEIHYLSIIRACSEIQFQVNHQIIDNQNRHKELSVAMVALHARLIGMVHILLNQIDKV
jgi:hypothetical protein